MKKRTTFERSVSIYNEIVGNPPSFSEITDLWHRYANNWKQYDGFADFLKEGLSDFLESYSK